MNDPKRVVWKRWLPVLLCVLVRNVWGLPTEANPGASTVPGSALPLGDAASRGIQSILKEGVHPRLRWSSFPDYQVPLEQLYQGRSYQPIWVQHGNASRQARDVIGVLSDADSQGLSAQDYDAKLLRDWVPRINASTSPQEVALFDVALSVSVVRYASHLFVGRINPRNVDYGLSIEPKKVDWPNFLYQLARSTHLREDFAALEPKLRLYEDLKAALVRYRELAGKAESAELTFPAKFSPGQDHPDVPKLRKLLATLGELQLEEAAGDSDTYDQSLAEAVKRFQKRHGVAADGVIGKSTLAHLQVPISHRVKQIQLGLERLRWLPEQLGGPYIMVNIPSFELFGFSDGFAAGKPDIMMNVIVGEAVDGRRTPVFASDMTYVVFRPHWNLPYKIAVKEMLPGAMRNPGYLPRHNIEIVSGFGPNSPVYAPTAQNLQLVSSGALKLRQRPGPKNALGLVKFAFPNNNNVYLHSTPNKGLFARARRDFSHGCIRVADPVGLAEWVLRNEGEWTRSRIQQAMNGTSPKTVTLSQPIPVYIFYSTVLADDGGRVLFFEDIYGHDQILQTLLDKGFPYPA